ncbi:MAG TPA: hypothetical protein PLG20_06870, partial [Candidatus Syntrophosphaera sp.]|nr:hypothetical protein [Candidatus Syntrophosphaera sp.]
RLVLAYDAGLKTRRYITLSLRDKLGQLQLIAFPSHITNEHEPKILRNYLILKDLDSDRRRNDKLKLTRDNMNDPLFMNLSHLLFKQCPGTHTGDVIGGQFLPQNL